MPGVNMHSFTYALTAGLVSQATAVIIEPALDALTWKFDEVDFWAPTQLKSNVYHTQSPAGSPPDSLTKRASPAGAHVGCTVITIDEDVQSLSKAVVEKSMVGYERDDVWSEQQFMGCLFVQYPGDGTLPIDKSFTEFLSEKGIETLYIDTAFEITGFAAAANVFSVKSNCDLSNGPYIATSPKCEEDGLSMTPVYTLHSDNYDGKSLNDTGDS